MLELIFGKYPGFIYKHRKPTNSLVEGIGLNDSPFQVAPSLSGVKFKHPAYKLWQNVLQRSFNHMYKNSHPTYKDVTCCEEWLLFTTFAVWFKDNYVEGYHLDKDILVKGNKKYSPETCIFVPSNINAFSTLSTASRGMLPLGVDAQNDKYRAQINNGRGVDKYLGTFNTKEEAHQEWQKAKLAQAIAFNFPPLQRIIDQLKFEIDNNLETIKL